MPKALWILSPAYPLWPSLLPPEPTLAISHRARWIWKWRTIRREFLLTLPRGGHSCVDNEVGRSCQSSPRRVCAFSEIVARMRKIDLRNSMESDFRGLWGGNENLKFVLNVPLEAGGIILHLSGLISARAARIILVMCTFICVL